MVTTLRLNKREERRLLAGHLWVFSNEIDTAATPLKGLEPGAPVRIESSTGRFLAHGYANPASLITARVTSRRPDVPFDATLLRARLADAMNLRMRRYPEPWWRWVHGEGDLLPGLVVDRHGDALVVQITTAGMERFSDEIIDALVSLSAASSVTLANDVPVREREGLSLYRKCVVGDEPSELHIQENGLSFTVPSEVTQKTGWFYDHRDNRVALRHWTRDARVLDLYGYLGAFGLNAAAGGAREVLSIDASAKAVAAANTNAAANGFESVFTAREDDAVEAMRALYEAGEKYDVVVLDPPAFVKRKKDLDAGLRHYVLNNKLALRLLEPGGILLSASCSQAVDESALARVIRQALPKQASGLQLLESLRQGADHPVHASVAESLYLKGSIARLM